MKDETLLPDDLIHMAISAIEDLLDHCDPSTDHYCGVWADVPDKLRAAIQSGNSGQPAGYVLVPVEPTQEMIDAHVEGVQSGGMRKGYRAMLASAPAVSDGWIPVSERMPEQRWSNRYLPLNLLLNGRTVVQGGFDDGRFWLDGVRIDNVTAWQPLPDAPKVKP